MEQKLAISDRSLELLETCFFFIHVKPENTTENCFTPQNEPYTAFLGFFWCFEAFSPEIDKKPHVCPTRAISERAKIYQGTTIFSQRV